MQKESLLHRILFTLVMASFMVYGMVVYNVALSTGGLTGQTFLLALHELPIMVPIAFLLEFFVVERLAAKIVFSFMRPTDRPFFITLAMSSVMLAITCPIMSFFATALFNDLTFAAWIRAWALNLPVAFFWNLFYCGPMVRGLFKLPELIKSRISEKDTDKGNGRAQTLEYAE